MGGGKRAGSRLLKEEKPISTMSFPAFIAKKKKKKEKNNYI